MNKAFSGGNASGMNDSTTGDNMPRKRQLHQGEAKSEEKEKDDKTLQLQKKSKPSQQVGSGSSMGITITVKTKMYDGGSQSQATKGKIADGSSDAFSRYSNTRFRMMHLLGLEDHEDTDEDILPHHDDRTTRKTRLSTELHHSVFMEMLFSDIV